MKTRIIAFSSRGCALASRICGGMEDCECYAKTIGDENGAIHVDSVDEWTRESFEICDAIVFIGAMGIAVRHIAPYLKNKAEDPAVIVIDELGINVIPILSGHIGGANALSKEIAGKIGAREIITTATDLNNVFSVDTYAVENNMYVRHLKMIKFVSARLLENMPVFLKSDFPIEGDIPKGIEMADEGDVGILISSSMDRKPFGKTLKLVPRHITIGLGCRRGVPAEVFERRVFDALKRNNLSINSVKAAGSIELKKDETGMLEFCRKFDIPIKFFTAEELSSVEGDFTESEYVKKVTGVGSVCERAAVAVSDGGQLIMGKDSGDDMTIAIVSEDYVVKFGGV